MENKQRTISIDQDVKVVKLRVKTGTMINDNTILLIYKEMNNGSEGTEQKKLKSTKIGVVKRVSVKEGDIVKSGLVIEMNFFLVKNFINSPHVLSSFEGL